ncbi:peptidase S9 prolyl oligopeptidase active site domain protein [Oceanithermus profundus DSM 14977]|uniref:Peptidase S9 prolyl oligopeptidase active site domain protein n=1 Tax=Oceanithermus profundus (strain DSM 14977 / NBRC 100410 / VKM B-2274 / 506) TaxID=670487 RepID=E4UAF8_OCEP5|nr:S9 family peptidase [Oceanithermus profundus]ADR37663.1 peptidase S9 prolyl oligopeptidase active site domain protein [Oceanithermus profundus DSM 14977]
MSVRSPRDLTRARLGAHAEVRARGGRVYWTEQEGGRTVLTGWDGAPRRYAPDHALSPGVGYGGGAFNLDGDAVLYVAEGRVWRLPREGREPVPLTPPFGAAADPQPSPDGARVVYVHHHEGRDVLAVAGADPDGWPRVWARGADFYMQPAWSPDGAWLAWVEWDHPNMPWDGARLMLARVEGGGPAEVRQLAGGARTPVFQPLFDPEGRGLFWIENPEGAEFDRLVRLDLETGERSVWMEERALIEPAWSQAQRVMSFGPGGALYLRENRAGRAHLWRLTGGAPEELPLPEGAAWLASLSGDEAGLAALASGPDQGERVVFYDGEAWQTRAYGWPAGLDGGGAAPEGVRFQAEDGAWVHGLFYPPSGGAERPPAVVSVHGGPTSQRTLAFNPQAQLFAANGYAYLELNYRGSTGYGRSYREALYGRWGEVDVADAAAAARFLAESGRADGRRLAVLGGSAGGYTVLMTLARFPGVYRAGVSFYGVTDLFGLARETHKFESRYTDRLVGPLPEAAARYRERSPLAHAHRIQDALYVFQGSEDRVVPPNQAEALVRILRERGVPHRYKVYEGEGHGWKKPETVRDFYRETLDFLEREVRRAP